MACSFAFWNIIEGDLWKKYRINWKILKVHLNKKYYRINFFLLHLIKKNKLNIYDIQISELLTQYMAHIDKMKEQSLDISSEFLEMAARLVYIKTAFLLAEPSAV